jgi:hypothetical protein
MSGIIIAAVVVSCTGLLLGLFLGVMGKKFYVEVDQKEIDVRAELPGNNCGGCGYAGCDALAKAIAAGEAPANACPVGGAITRMNTIVFRYVSLSGVSIQSYIRLQTADEIVITPITAPPIPAAVFIFLETPRKGHKPRNWLKTTLLTIAVLTAINNNCEKYPIFTSLSYS